MAKDARTQITSVAEIAVLALTSEAKLGTSKLILIDGPAGSGKTTLARMLQSEVGAQVIHMDDLYHGWEDALTSATMNRIVQSILLPLENGQLGKYQKFDWYQNKFLETFEVTAGSVIIEGVGSASAPIRKYASYVVWLEVDPQLGLSRVLNRDGAQITNEMLTWQKTEQNWHKIDNTRNHANLILSGERADGLALTEYFALTK